MIVRINITEKSFGAKLLISKMEFSVNDGEKIGIIGRNGVGKTTLFNILAGNDKDFMGEISYRRQAVVTATQQEYHEVKNQTVLQYILVNLPEYQELSKIINEYPDKMGDDLRMIDKYTTALQRFSDKGFYQIEERLIHELEIFQLKDMANRDFKTLSGGQKRLVEIIRVVYSQADLILIDEPTNYMDYVAKDQFLKWFKNEQAAIMVITHDRDVLKNVDRIIEFKDGTNVNFKGNYDTYLKQNTVFTNQKINDFELIGRQITNLKAKIIDYQRLKEKSRSPSTIQRFKRLEQNSRQLLAELQEKDKPTFWIDQNSVENLSYKESARYDKFKTKNIKLNIKDEASKSSKSLVKVQNLALGYDQILFENVNFNLLENGIIELRGRNGSGKTTLINALLGDTGINIFDGEIEFDSQVRIGFYQQEIDDTYLDLPLQSAIEKIYTDANLQITDTKIHQLAKSYLFDSGDLLIPINRLSGGQKARLQLIKMLANDPQILILDEPTSHLDLPSIEELENALKKYSGAILYVSHDNYFRNKIGGEVVMIG